MKNSVKNSFRLLVLLCVMLFGVSVASAAGADVSVSSATMEKGGTASVTFKVSSSGTIGSFVVTINYDSSVAEFTGSNADGSVNGGGGVIKITDAPYSSSSSFTLYFKAVAPGTTNLAITVNELIDGDFEDMTVNKSAGSITVNKPREASSDNTLSKLSVSEGTLSPAFNKDVTEYSIEVSSAVTALTINAVPTSDRAWTDIGGNINLKTGSVVDICVVAENGDRKDYRIKVTKAAPTNTPIPTDSPIPTPGVGLKAETYEKGENGVLNRVQADLELRSTLTADAPVGFDKGSVVIDGVTAEAYVQADGNVTLVQLSDGALYRYDSAANACYPFRKLQTIGCMYIVCAAPADRIPAGYKEIAVSIDNVVYPAYALSENDEFVLVYNESGVWYRYDTKEGTFQRHVSDGIPTPGENPIPVPGVTEAPIVTPSADVTIDPSVTDEVTPTEKPAEAVKADDDFNIVNIVKLAIVALVFVLAIVFMVLYVKEKHKNEYYEEDENNYVQASTIEPVNEENAFVTGTTESTEEPLPELNFIFDKDDDK